MKTLVLSIILCALTLNASAWQTFPEATKEKSDEEAFEILKKDIGKFYASCDHKGPGISIYALNCKENSTINIRKINDSYDIKVSIYEPIWSCEGTVYLDLIDKEGFRIKSLEISKVCGNFSGNLFERFNGNFDRFCDVYSYEINLRG